MVYGFIRGQGIRAYRLIVYWPSKGHGYLEVGILYGGANLAGKSEKQRQQINDESCVIYQYVEKI
jgi:hypothetical protein